MQARFYNFCISRHTEHSTKVLTASSVYVYNLPQFFPRFVFASCWLSLTFPWQTCELLLVYLGCKPLLVSAAKTVRRRVACTSNCFWSAPNSSYIALHVVCRLRVFERFLHLRKKLSRLWSVSNCISDWGDLISRNRLLIKKYFFPCKLCHLNLL